MIAKYQGRNRHAMTAKGLDVLRFIRDRVDAGLPPTIREVASFLGSTSPNAAMHHIRTLQALGYIERDTHLARGIKIVMLPRELRNDKECCPACGRPLESQP